MLSLCILNFLFESYEGKLHSSGPLAPKHLPKNRGILLQSHSCKFTLIPCFYLTNPPSEFQGCHLMLFSVSSSGFWIQSRSGIMFSRHVSFISFNLEHFQTSLCLLWHWHTGIEISLPTPHFFIFNGSSSFCVCQTFPQDEVVRFQPDLNWLLNSPLTLMLSDLMILEPGPLHQAFTSHLSPAGGF